MRLVGNIESAIIEFGDSSDYYPILLQVKLAQFFKVVVQCEDLLHAYLMLNEPFEAGAFWLTRLNICEYI